MNETGSTVVDPIEENLRQVSEVIVKLKEENKELTRQLRMREDQIGRQHDEVFGVKSESSKPRY